MKLNYKMQEEINRGIKTSWTKMIKESELMNQIDLFSINSHFTKKFEYQNVLIKKTSMFKLDMIIYFYVLQYLK